MRILTFSDIHGNGSALRAFQEALKGESFDRLLFLGDVFGYYYDQKEIMKTLSDMKELIWLRGNHDAFFSDLFKGKKEENYYIQNYGSSYRSVKEHYSSADVELLDSHPSCFEMECDGLRIGFFHGTPDDPLEGRLYPDTEVKKPEAYTPYDLVVLGHTHRQMTRVIGRTTVINTGSLGQPRDGKGFVYMILDTKTRMWEYKRVLPDLRDLYSQIEKNDPELAKLKEILERKPGA